MTFRELIIIALVAGGLYVVGQYVASQPQRVEEEIQANREITVTGSGKITARPDVAQLMLGVTTGPQATAAAATELLSERFQRVVDAVEAEGVAEEDVQTSNLSINPVYDYREGQQTLRGFEASESIQVKIRDLDRVGAVISRAAAEGVNQAGGIQFIIDDPAALEREAQAEAIADAKENAEALARELGVGLGRVKAFSVTDGPVSPPFLSVASLEADSARGGDVPVPSGTNDVVVNVAVTYELR